MCALCICVFYIYILYIYKTISHKICNLYQCDMLDTIVSAIFLLSHSSLLVAKLTPKECHML